MSALDADQGAAPAAPTPRVEEAFHEDVWGLANNSMRMERAVTEARDILELLQSKAEKLGIDLEDSVLWAANHWLDTFGRSYRWHREQREAGS